MTQEIEAVYENGVLRPLAPVALAESQTVRILISTESNGSTQRDLKLLERAKAEVAAVPNVPTVEEIRHMLSAIPGSLSEDVTAQRGEY